MHSRAARSDLNRDGVIDSVDGDLLLLLLLLHGVGLPALPAGHISDPAHAGGPGNPVGYTGHLFDPDLGLYLARHRWYSPAQGRWVSRDPIGYLDGMNRYQYVHGNSIIGIDPLGLWRSNPIGVLEEINYWRGKGLDSLEVLVLRNANRATVCAFENFLSRPAAIINILFLAKDIHENGVTFDNFANHLQKGVSIGASFFDPAGILIILAWESGNVAANLINEHFPEVGEAIATGIGLLLGHHKHEARALTQQCQFLFGQWSTMQSRGRCDKMDSIEEAMDNAGCPPPPPRNSHSA